MKGQRKSCKISLEPTEFNPSQVIFPPQHIWFVTLQGGLCSFWAVQHVPGYRFKPQHLLGTTVLTGLEETPHSLGKPSHKLYELPLPPPPSAAFLVFKVLIFQGGKESWRLALIKEESAPKASYFWFLGASSAAHCHCWAHSNSISAVSMEVSLGHDSVVGDKRTWAAANLQEVTPPWVRGISIPHHRGSTDKAAITPATVSPAGKLLTALNCQQPLINSFHGRETKHTGLQSVLISSLRETRSKPSRF